MSFSKVLNAVSTSASASAQAQSTNAKRVYSSGSHSHLHIVTLMLTGAPAGASTYMMMGPAASVTASSPWTIVADSTMAAASAANFEIPDDCYLAFGINSVSAGATSVDLWLADSTYTR